jgi:hypothetical protein
MDEGSLFDFGKHCILKDNIPVFIIQELLEVALRSISSVQLKFSPS